MLAQVSLTYHYLGLRSYEEGLAAQAAALSRLERARQAADPRAGVVLGLEHASVVTLGKRGRPEDDLRVSREEIERRGFALFFSARGGQATLHMPGQLVIYPCLALAALGLSVREYVTRLEEVTSAFLSEYGINAKRGADEPGLYTDKGKIAFFGIRVERGLASHGIAINIANDLSAFALIRSCGKSGEAFDQMKNYGISSPLSDLFEVWVAHFLRALA